MVSLLAECWPLYWRRYLLTVSWYVDHHSADISVNTLVDTSTNISRSSYQPRVGRYVDWHIGRHSADITTDTSVKCRSICQLIYPSRGAQNTHDPFILYYLADRLLISYFRHTCWFSGQSVPCKHHFKMHCDKITDEYIIYWISL